MTIFPFSILENSSLRLQVVIPRPKLTLYLSSSIRIPPTFHDYLRSCSASNTLLLTLFTTSACASCRTVTPLLTSLVRERTPSPVDRFTSIAFSEAELDSPDESNGRMTDIGIEYGVASIPTLVGFGGRRAERVTDRIVDKGDPHDTGGGSGGGLFGKLFS
jgi:hypothetical protein